MTDLNVSSLLGIVQAIDKSRVLVLGDIMLDRFIYGHVDRISPESPVPVLSIKREDVMLGGAGNALANLAGLESEGSIISLIGADSEGKAVAKQLKALKCNNDLVVDKDRPTIVKTRYLAGQQQLLRSDFEKKGQISDDSARKIVAAVKKVIKKADVLVLSDYGKGLLRDDVIADVIATARESNVKVIVDPKGQDFSKYAGAYAVTPNKKELSEAAGGRPVDTDEEVVAAAKKIISGCDIETVIATRSKDGISVVSRGKAPMHFRTINVEVFDVSGAGDTVIATLAAAVAANATLAQAATLANIAGSIVVQKVGTAKIRREELADALHDDGILAATGIQKDSGSVRAKKTFYLPDEALETIKRWRSKGYKIGFTNGCFDILHQGHVTYLAETRQHCDKLIVALNKDSSVRILKGEERPVHGENARATVLSALSSVSMVVLFGADRKGQDNTASKLLQLLKPDIYFKGGDYTVDQIPETPTVRGYGGEVVVLSEVKGQSTTNSIAKMRSGKAA